MRACVCAIADLVPYQGIIAKSDIIASCNSGVGRCLEDVLRTSMSEDVSRRVGDLMIAKRIHPSAVFQWQPSPKLFFCKHNAPIFYVASVAENRQPFTSSCDLLRGVWVWLRAGSTADRIIFDV